MQGTLKFNENNKRFSIEYGNSTMNEITSGYTIKVYYKDLVLYSSIEHNGSDYYMTAYPEISLKSLVSSQAEIC